MRWNIYYMDRGYGKIVSRYIGQVEAHSQMAAEQKACRLCKEITGAMVSSYVARDPEIDDWHRPKNFV